MTDFLASREPIEIFLQPGEFYFGDAHTRIRTLLGSCVSITMWHPRLRQGGMCHFMLPARPNRRSRQLDGRYADDAVALFMRELRANGTRPAEYEVKLFGGGRMFGVRAESSRVIATFDVGMRNTVAAHRLLKVGGFRIKAEHQGGDGHRSVIFDIASGEVWIRHVATQPGDAQPNYRTGYV